MTIHCYMQTLIRARDLAPTSVVKPPFHALSAAATECYCRSMDGLGDCSGSVGEAKRCGCIERGVDAGRRRKNESWEGSAVGCTVAVVAGCSSGRRTSGVKRQHPNESREGAVMPRTVVASAADLCSLSYLLSCRSTAATPPLSAHCTSGCTWCHVASREQCGPSTPRSGTWACR